MALHLLGYAFSALSLLLSLSLFLALRRELAARQLRARATWKELEDGLRALTAQVEVIGKALQESEERAGLLAPPTAPRSGFNLNKRTQALRMHRRGDSPSQIATALGIPAKELELLVKVQRIVLGMDLNPH